MRSSTDCDVCVVIPTIAPRSALLHRALDSVGRQTFAPANVSIAYDRFRQGSAATRNRALAGVYHTWCPWVAFLDDDDEMMPHHLARLMQEAIDTDADVVYSLPRVIGPTGETIPRQFDWGGGAVFDPDYLRRKAHIQTTSLVRTELAQRVGGFVFREDDTGAMNDDHGFYVRCLDAGAKFMHVHEETFLWHHHGYGTPGVSGNTSGMPDRW